MSGLWIVIIAYAALSTIIVVGLWRWWLVMEKQEHESFSNLRDAKEKIGDALKQYPEKKPEDAVIVVLSELPFPVQKYAENIKARTEIQTFMIAVMTELKHMEEPGATPPGSTEARI